MTYCKCDNCGYYIDIPYTDVECPKCHKGKMKEMKQMDAEEPKNGEEEWEMEILAFIKGTEKAKEAVCEVHAALLNYPLTYIDTKLTKPKLELQEILKDIQDIQKAIKERVVWADYDLTRKDHQELLANIMKSKKILGVQLSPPAIIKIWWIQSE